MSRIQCKGCEHKPSEYDTLEGYCMLCAAKIIKKSESKPDTGEFTKKFREQLDFNDANFIQEKTRVLGYEACDTIDRQAAENAKLSHALEIISAAKANTGHLTGEDCKHIAEAALKGTE